MDFTPNSSNETLRLKALDSYSILDTFSDRDYDNLTAIASEVCNIPISLISLVDDQRQWFKSHHGLPVDETPKEYSFCAHAIQQPDQLFVVPDARKDKRFLENPLVTGDPYIVFYAGVPLVTEEGMPLGTLCVIDKKPRRLTKNQKKALEALSNQVMKLLELRKSKYELRKANEQLEEKNKMLEGFAEVAAGDIQSPLRNIANSYATFQKEYSQQLDNAGVQLLSSMENSTAQLSSMVDGILQNAKTDYVKRREKENVSSAEIQQKLVGVYPKSGDYTIEFSFKAEELYINMGAVLQLLLNLISNAIRYSDKAVAQVEVGVREDERFYEFFVSDDGPGIDDLDYERIFEIFTVLNRVDRYGEYGVGLGLANAKKLVEESGGDITVDSELGKGTIFTFSLPK